MDLFISTLTMHLFQTDTLIIGGGLSGLHAAGMLEGAGKDMRLVEARDRLGGRIHSAVSGGGCYDVGPSWFWPEVNPRLRRLVAEMNLRTFPQYTEGSSLFEAPGRVIERQAYSFGQSPESWRIAGGMNSLVNALTSDIPEGKILTSSQVTEVRQTDPGVEIEISRQGEKITIEAGQVIFALPPRLLAGTIRFSPVLPIPLIEAFAGTPTWMAGHAKAFVLYDRPFWRKAGLSGDAFSQIGPLTEIHDASPLDDGSPALFGFFGVPARLRRNAKEQMQPAVIQQLVRLFGEEATTPLDFIYQDWALESFTATLQDETPPRMHPFYKLPTGAQGLWDGRLFFAGTEAAPEYGGFVEGALESAENAVRLILS